MSDIQELLMRPATELRRMLGNGEVSAVELMAFTLERIEERNSVLNAYISLRADEAMAEARIADSRAAKGDELGPLHGLPLAIKGLAGTKTGLPINFGCAPLVGFMPTATTAYIARLEAAGAIVVGATNVAEFGHKGVTDNLVNGATSAPWRLGFNAGGSSGGSAAAVADGLCAIAMGSDGGGSVRIPAAMCGVFGYKTSVGRIPVVNRPNGFGGHSPYVHVGPLTRSVADSEMILQVLTDTDARDPMSRPREVDAMTMRYERTLAGVRVGYTPDYGGFPIDRSVRAVVDVGVARLVELGAEVVPVEIALPAPHDAITQMWIRQSAASGAAGALDRARRTGVDLFSQLDRLSPGYAAMLELGARLSAVDLRLDDILRTGVLDAIEDALEGIDLLVGPTLSVAAVANRDDGLTVGPSEVDGRAVDPRIGWCPTLLTNFTGHPSASVPIGRTEDGAPVGLHVIGQRFDDRSVLETSAAIELAYRW